jgi:PAS domain S-box-containing protein
MSNQNSISYNSSFTIQFIIFGLVLSISSTLVYYLVSDSTLKQNILTQQKKEIIFIENRFDNFLSNKKESILSLKYNLALSKYLQNKSKENLKSLEYTLLTYAQANNIYSQVRVIDKHGMEIARVNNQGSKTYIVQKDELQDKSDRYYFKSVKDLPLGDVWFSNLDLNIEHKKIQRPILPTIRIAVGLGDDEFDGMAIININMRDFLKSMNEIDTTHVYIVDKDGEFLLHPNYKYRWSKYLNSGYTIEDEFENYKEIKSATNSILKNNIIVKSIHLDNKEGLKFIFVPNYDLYKKLSSEYTNMIIIHIVIILILSIPFAYMMSIRPSKVHKRLMKLSRAIEQSDNLVCITNKDKIIEYVNPAFINTSGYKKDELVGKPVNILKSNKVSQDTYKDMYEHINSGQVWYGDFVNKKRDGTLYSVRTTISSIKDDNNEITHYLAVQYNNTKELSLQKELEEKDKILVNHYKFNALNELLKNISHHWRQPLNNITILASSLSDIDEIDDKKERDEILEHSISKIISQAEFLSETIDKFKTASLEHNKKNSFLVSEVVDTSITLVSPELKEQNIKIYRNGGDFEIYSYKESIIDILISIYKNAEESIQNKRASSSSSYDGLINVKIDSNKIYIYDNGLGILSKDIDKIFEPYYTTKFKDKGVGLSLYMDKLIMKKSLDGDLYAIADKEKGIIVLDFSRIK